MKHLKSYNESLLDKMTAKSDEEIKAALGDITKIKPYEKVLKGIKNQIPWLIQMGFGEFEPKKFNDRTLYFFLTEAVMSGDPEIVKLIFDNGASVELEQQDGYLFTGAFNIGSIGIMKVLMEHGFKVDGIEHNMHKVYNMMDYDNHYDVIKFIIDNSPKVKVKIERHIKELEENLEKIKKFV